MPALGWPEDTTEDTREDTPEDTPEDTTEDTTLRRPIASAEVRAARAALISPFPRVSEWENKQRLPEHSGPSIVLLSVRTGLDFAVIYFMRAHAPRAPDVEVLKERVPDSERPEVKSPCSKNVVRQG